MADDFLSSILAQLTAPVDGGGQSAPAPVQPPLAPDAQPQSDLQKKVADAKAVQAAPDVQPQMSQPTSLSGPLPIPSELSQAPQGAAAYPQVKGGLPGLLAGLINPARGVAPGQMVPSKAERFESFLTNFLVSLSQGLAQEGRGPGSAMRGAAAAMQAPYQQAVGQYQLNQQSQANQAQIQNERLKSQLTAAQIEQMKTSIPVQMPNGSLVFVPAKDVGHVLGSVAGDQGKVGAAQIAADNKLSVEEMKAAFANGKVAKTLPAQDKDGNIGVRQSHKIIM